MSQEHRDEPDDRGAVVLSPKAPAEGTFALLVPDNMHWEVSRFGGARGAPTGLPPDVVGGAGTPAAGRRAVTAARTAASTWQKRVERWAASGLGCKEYAAQIGANPNTLAGWRWKLRREAQA